MDRPPTGPRSRRRREALVALASFTSVLATIGRPQTALAHRSRVALTRLAANDAAATWEFTTTLHLHDAAGALVKLTGDPGADPTSPTGSARLALELERSVKWTGPDGQALPLTLEGAELLGNDLAFYQSSPAPAIAGECSVEGRFLRSVFPDMAHTLQFELTVPPRTERLTSTRTSAVFAWSPPASA